MNSETHDRFTTREGILGLLSDEENARVSTAEGLSLSEGDEYVDLTRIEQGVQRADGIEVPIGHVLPKKAVHERTWSNILKQMAHSHGL